MPVRKDPRYRNQTFSTKSISAYLRDYAVSIEGALRSIRNEDLERAYQLIQQTVEKERRIYVGGNGGSAAIADHLGCDFTKGTYDPSRRRLKVHSLVSNVALLTACANDFGYDESLAAQLEMYGEKEDLVILISSSGNSANILQAAKVAKEKQMHSLGFTGFSGGELRGNVDVCIHVEFNNYGIVEDSHQILMHCLAQFLACAQDAPSPSKD